MLQRPLEFALSALIRVHNDLACRLASPNRHHQGVQYDVPCQRRFHRPAHDLAGVEIDDHGEIKPALPGSDIGDIGRPDLIGAGDRELAIESIRRNDLWSVDDMTRCLVAT